HSKVHAHAHTHTHTDTHAETHMQKHTHTHTHSAYGLHEESLLCQAESGLVKKLMLTSSLNVMKSSCFNPLEMDKGKGVCMSVSVCVCVCVCLTHFCVISAVQAERQ